jgi:hypothetical protein
MWQFLSSPRRVLGSISALACFALAGMALNAWADRPGLEVASVNKSWTDFFLGPYNVSVVEETYVLATWECRDKDGRQVYDADAVCSRLQSRDFLDSYREAAIARHHHLSELFDATGGERLVCNCHRNKETVQPRDVLYVRVIFSRRFKVHAPTYVWSAWFQKHLPFMQDRMALQKIADERNRDAIDVLDSRVRTIFPVLQLQATSGQDVPW